MTYQIIDESYCRGDTAEIARNLLGTILVHFSPEGLTSGIIVETEAYLSQNDPACHAARGKTKRNAAMFGPPARAYVYFIYGNHYCFNVVTNEAGKGEAVLIRALEPVKGLHLMQERRGKNHKKTNLTSGPGKLCQAMGITGEHNGCPLFQDPLFIAICKGWRQDFDIGVSGRIGINKAQDKQLRFFVKGNPFVSR
ncbi:MAG: DNA-3-methyladenine glycosylase [Firmicutes bacterium]|nr:DNA-3-methyladenine glycosylase [Bacillota bacterium]